MAGEQPIAPEHLPEAVTRPVVPAQGATLEQWADAMLEEVLASGAAAGYEELMRRWEEPLLAAGMKRFAGNQARLAAALHLHRSTLRKKLRACGLIDGGPEPPSGRDM